MKLKNNLKKLISFALVTAMLVCSVFTMSVNAVNNENNMATDIDFEQLAEALANIDEENYEIYEEDGIVIKRINLNYDFYIETFVESQESLSRVAGTKKTGTDKLTIYNSNGTIVSVSLVAEFEYDGSSAYVISSRYDKQEVSGVTVTVSGGISVSNNAPGAMASGSPTLTITIQTPYSSTNYNSIFQLNCTPNGVITSWH